MEKFNINGCFDRLTPDDHSYIRLHELIPGPNSLWIAELKPGKTLPAHYHTQGSEIYHILSGKGKIETGTLAENGVTWDQAMDIGPADVFEISQDQVHSLANTGDQPMKIVFITPPSHLREDRIFVQSREARR